MKLTALREEHYPFVKEIYQEGISTGHATFQRDIPLWKDWDSAHLQHSRWLAVENGMVAGWAALTGVSGRCVYAGVAEVSVYVGADYRGRGVGSLLLAETILSSEANNIWTLQAGIFPENIASLQLHYKQGFRLVGTREKVGRMNGVWRDTLLLERRSKITGIA